MQNSNLAPAAEPIPRLAGFGLSGRPLRPGLLPLRFGLLPLRSSVPRRGVAATCRRGARGRLLRGSAKIAAFKVLDPLLVSRHRLPLVAFRLVEHALVFALQTALAELIGLLQPLLE